MPDLDAPTTLTLQHLDPLPYTDRTRVLRYTAQRDREPGTYAYGLVLAETPDDTTPYVVWRAIARPAGVLLECGDYCWTLEQAEARYLERGGVL